MKTFWSILAKILLLVVIIETWFVYDLHTKNKNLLAKNIELENKVLRAEKDLGEAFSKIESLEKKSLEGVLKETNKAVISGWELLLKRVEEELGKARETLSDLLGDEEEKQSTGDQATDSGSEETQPPANNGTAPIQGERT